MLGAFLAHEVLRGGHWAPYTDTLGEPTSPAYAVARGALGGEAGFVVAARRAKAAYHASSYASRRLAAVAGDNLEFASMVAGAFRRNNASLDVDRCRRVALWALFTVLNRAVELGGRLGYSLVPFWDIINHGAPRHSQRFVTLRYDDGSVEYFQDGYRGGELFHNYSFQSACPMDWVTTYGFVPEDLVAASAAPPDDAAENALGVWAPGCSDVVVRGVTYSVPGDEADLLAFAAASDDGARLAATALAARADALLPDAALAAGADAADALDRDAAVVMRLERRALLRALRRLPRGAGEDPRGEL